MTVTTTITLAEGTQYLSAAFVSTVLLLLGQMRLVERYRKKADIPYPQMYADKAQQEASPDAKIFNFAQRAHQNTLENIPIVYISALLTGLKFPVLAATGLGLWTLSRVSYTRAYITGGPEKMATPLFMLGMASTLGLVGASVYISGVALYRGIVTIF